MNATLRTLRTLRDETEAAWDQCVDTAGLSADGEQDPAKVAEAEEAREGALDHWQDAAGAIARGDIATAREELAAARELAREWGDDGPERKAIDALALAPGPRSKTMHSDCGLENRPVPKEDRLL